MSISWTTGKESHIDIEIIISYFIVSVFFFLQDGEIMNAANAIDDDEVDNAWKTMQQQTAVKGHSSRFD